VFDVEQGVDTRDHLQASGNWGSQPIGHGPSAIAPWGCDDDRIALTGGSNDRPITAEDPVLQFVVARNCLWQDKLNALCRLLREQFPDPEPLGDRRDIGIPRMRWIAGLGATALEAGRRIEGGIFKDVA
jgi:hypothetical protein